MTHADVVIIGGGLSGLVCAYNCQKKGVRTHILEATQTIGGRVQSDCIDGVVCDRGFQVFLPAYPIASTLFKPLGIEWKTYPKTAIIHGDKLRWFGAPFTSGIGEKLRLTPRDYWYLFRDIFSGLCYPKGTTTVSTQAHIQRYSPTVSDQFLRPFFSSVFLDPKLQAPAQLFQYYLSLFVRGGVAVPSQGMGEITQRLAAQLNPDTIKTSTQVTQINKRGGVWQIATSSEKSFSASITVIATAHHHACELVADLPTPSCALPVSTHYFLTDKLPDAIGPLTLFPAGTYCHHIAIPTVIAPDYTPDHRHLIMATTYGTDTVSADAVLDELGRHTNVQNWSWIHHVRLSYSLPNIHAVKHPDPTCILAGDWTAMPSIEGACQSGMLAAQSIGIV